MHKITGDDSYLDVNENEIIGISVEGLGHHFRTYDLYVYLDAGDRDSEAGDSVRSISDGTTQYYLNDADGNTFTGCAPTRSTTQHV